jgi:hypothetical protein
VAGEEELRAKAVLAEMQMRISQGPYAALSLGESASADQVRAAFLDLTKQFHPARFGRMSPDVLRLANEVFLGIKSAHDQLMMMLGAPRHLPRGSTAIPFPPGISGGTQRGVAAPSGARGIDRGTDRGIDRGTERGIDRGTDRGIDRGTERGIDRGTDRPLARPSTPAMKTPSVGTPRPPSPTNVPRPPSPSPTNVPRPATPRFGTPPTDGQRPSTPDPSARQTQSGVPAPTRPTTPVSTSRLGSPPGQRPATPPGDASSTARFGTQPQRASTTLDEETMLKQAMDLLSSKDWSGARLALHALAAKVPQARNYRALLCYARGRETAATGRVDDAVMEFQRALQLDPDLEIAKTAIREVQRKGR